MATTEQAAANQRPANTDEVLTPSDRREILIEPVAKQKAEQPKEEGPDVNKTIDRMGNELGELRKQNKLLMDQLQSMQQAQTAEPPATFEEDPQTFIQQSVQAALEQTLGPKLQVLESDLLMRQGQRFDEQLSQTYPDWKETIAKDGFAEWIKASPARMQMYQMADSNYDVDSAVELLKRYRQDQAEAEASKVGAINAAGLVQGGGDTGGARVYAASEIKRMQRTDPEQYRSWLAGDGMKAYAEGRIDQTR